MFILGKSAERIDEDHDGEMWRLDVDDGGVDARETETWERSDDGNEVPIGNLKLEVPTVGLEVDVDDDGDGDDAGVCIPFSSP